MTRTMPQPASTRRAVNFCLRHFSVSTLGSKSRSNHLPAASFTIKSSSSPTSPALPPTPTPTPTAEPAATKPLPLTTTTTSSAPSPPWLNRWLHLWDQKSGTHEILQLKENVNISSTEFDTKQSGGTGPCGTRYRHGDIRKFSIRTHATTA